tara:strand:- start:383 stop:559 length:177 start_codon:yes stop_codon:yes gene_type:complete
MTGKHGAGKGDKYRPVDLDKYRENWEAIFGDSNRKRNSSSNTKGVSKKSKKTSSRDKR